MTQGYCAIHSWSWNIVIADPPPFLKLKSLLKPKFQRASIVGGRPIGDASNVLLHQRNCRGVPEVRNEEIALHLHDLIPTKRTPFDVDPMVQ